MFPVENGLFILPMVILTLWGAKAQENQRSAQMILAGIAYVLVGNTWAANIWFDSAPNLYTLALSLAVSLATITAGGRWVRSGIMGRKSARNQSTD